LTAWKFKNKCSPQKKKIINANPNIRTAAPHESPNTFKHPFNKIKNKTATATHNFHPYQLVLI
jgi:hypothetical protein